MIPDSYIALWYTIFYTIPYYTILYYTILYYTILYYTILYYTILYYTILYDTILSFTILYHTSCECNGKHLPPCAPGRLLLQPAGSGRLQPGRQKQPLYEMRVYIHTADERDPASPNIYYTTIIPRVSACFFHGMSCRIYFINRTT